MVIYQDFRRVADVIWFMIRHQNWTQVADWKALSTPRRPLITFFGKDIGTDEIHEGTNLACSIKQEIKLNSCVAQTSVAVFGKGVWLITAVDDQPCQLISIGFIFAMG